MLFTHDFVPKLSQVEREQWIDKILAVKEPEYQKSTYRRLVTRIIDDANGIYPVSYIECHLVDEINESTRQHVRGWIEENQHLGVEICEENFLWSVKLNPSKSGFEIDHFPETLLRMGEGTSDIRLFRPSYELLMRMINMEIRRSQRSAVQVN